MPKRYYTLLVCVDTDELDMERYSITNDAGEDHIDSECEDEACEEAIGDGEYELQDIRTTEEHEMRDVVGQRATQRRFVNKKEQTS